MHPRSKKTSGGGTYKMALLKKLFNRMFTRTSALEEFIVSKKPTNASDVEHWTRRYYEGELRGL